ncbi:MAG: 5'-methylthioadenosine phosphorylase, partial [Betaproteobacteria bacterium]|nr:5'-methylthioadenosine phosphorylase [Betaproteobacteria bacterium]
CWRDDPAEHATVEAILARFAESISRARRVIAAVVKNPPPVDEARRRAASGAVMTPPEARTAEHNALLEVLLA